MMELSIALGLIGLFTPIICTYMVCKAWKEITIAKIVAQEKQAMREMDMNAEQEETTK